VNCVDPFNGGSSATLYVSAAEKPELLRAARTVASLALRAEASPGELRDVLEALGLIGPQGPPALTARQKLKAARALPDPPKPSEKPSAAELEVTPAATKARRTAAIARARQILAAAPTEEAPPTNEHGEPVLRCRSRLHHKTGANVRVRKDGNRQCVPCEILHRAKATLRELAAWEEV
jgi:hypothetical protein